MPLLYARDVDTAVIDVTTGARRVTDLTAAAAGFVVDRGDGLLHVFVPHATAGLAVFELGAGSDDDLDELLDRLVPRDERYVHRHGSPGHGADHLVPTIVSPSLTVPVLDGRLALGTWQSIALVDTNVDNPRRQVRFSFLPG
jgi:secondary thiamine-phosphate synthase enzyme